MYFASLLLVDCKSRKRNPLREQTSRVCFAWRNHILANLTTLLLTVASATDGGLRIVTWLILPVVICLSQRLSHACLSISIIQRNCEWLIKTVIVYMIIEFTWITVVILELIHAG